ncbi:MAG: RecX family transcriptional regulator [Chloroflexota bacterium]|nr:RecX family transcriptional regulator [Chloroflexota bacterium]
MPGTITALRVQKKNKQRVNVYLDGEFAFGLAGIEAAKLHRGQYLSDEDIAYLREQDTRETAYERALNFLSYRPRSEAEVRRYLQEKQVPLSVQDEVVARLTRAGLLDDHAFARYWVENRERFKPRGVYALRSEMRQKGLGDDVISAVLEELDEEENAYRAAKQRAARWKQLDYQSFRRKLGAYLRRRGFAFETIEAAIVRVWHELQAEGEHT